MKNIAAVILSFVLFAQARGQSFQLLENGTLIPAQPSYVHNVPDTMGDEFLLDCRNLSSTTKSVVVRMTILSTPDGCSNDVYFCDAVACYPPSVFQSPTPFAIAAGAAVSPAVIPHLGTGTCCGDYAVNYCVYDVSHSSDSVNVVMHYHVTGNNCTNLAPELEPALFLAAYPNPAGRTAVLDFNLNQPGPVTVELFCTTGQKIRSYKTENASGKINLDVSALPDGVYILSASASGRKWSAQPLIVIHP